MLTDSKHPHDALFKKAFSEVEHAAAEFRAVLPAQLLAVTDFSTLALCAGSYVDEALAGSQSDLLFSVKVSGKPALLYVLFEHQSSPDKLMPLRLLRYVVRILERHIKQAKTPGEALPLPPVVPLVLHHSENGWSVARRLEELFDAELVKAAGLSELIPRLSFVLDDLNELTDDELEGRALGLFPLLALWAMRDARNVRRLERSLGHWVPVMAQLVQLANGQEALWTLFRYIALVADDQVADKLSQAVNAAPPQVKDALMTIAEKWIAEGKAEGKAEVLRKLLTLKFGELPEATLSRLGAATEADLDRWIELVLGAETLDAVVNR